jgi:hypothetical protein
MVRMWFAAVSALACSGLANAQTLGGVHGPSVSKADRSAEYRVAYVPESDGRRASASHRLHYQHALDGAHRLRAIVNAEETGRGLWEADSLQAEWLWQFKERGQGIWSSGLRFDYRGYLRAGQADRLRLNWTNQWDLDNRWRLRWLAQGYVETGADRRDGVWLETRASALYPVRERTRVGIEMFNGFGNLDNPGTFNQQAHRIGPVVSFRHEGGWSSQWGALFGASERAPEADLRIWVGKAF